MGIANNFLMETELLDFFHKNLALHSTDLTYGTSLFGSHRLFKALCLHYNSSAFSPVSPVLPEHIMTGPGCGPLLDQIFEHLADPGDGVLIAAPYYNGFDADLSCRSAVKGVPVYSSTDDGTGADNFEGKTAMRGFKEALEKYQGKIRAVIVCNPSESRGAKIAVQQPI
jgi:1-aminocyclopropane-1-carboxylate synthase